MNYKEAVVAKVNDLENGEMKTVTVREARLRVLLSRIGGEFYAVAAFCPHYGAPLADGVLCGERVVCPWHQASFNAKTGELLEPPSSDALPRFEVLVKGEEVILRFPQNFGWEKTPQMSKYEPECDSRTFVIIGSGAAGNAAAQALREVDFKGHLIVLTCENEIPYDRPKLSKKYLEGKVRDRFLPLRSEEFYDEHDIELLRNRMVVGADISSKLIKLERGETLRYDKLLIATGGEARNLGVPGSDLGNIFTLRTFADAKKILKAAEDAANVVVIGASFIGLEVAYSLAKQDLDLTVIAPENVPFEYVFGEEIGNLFRREHEEIGVEFKLGETVSKFEGEGKVEAVELASGVTISADMVVVGIGVHPATDFINGVELAPDGGVLVDEYLRAASDVYAAGDIASFPDPRTGERIRIEHWRTAEQQGRVAAYNMTGKEVPFDKVPFFWTNQGDLNFQYVGYAAEWDEIVFQGELSSKKFVAFYVKDGKVLAAAGNNTNKELGAVSELMRLGKMPAPERIRDASIDLIEALKDC